MQRPSCAPRDRSGEMCGVLVTRNVVLAPLVWTPQDAVEKDGERGVRGVGPLLGPGMCPASGCSRERLSGGGLGRGGAGGVGTDCTVACCAFLRQGSIEARPRRHDMAARRLALGVPAVQAGGRAGSASVEELCVLPGAHLCRSASSGCRGGGGRWHCVSCVALLGCWSALRTWSACGTACASRGRPRGPGLTVVMGGFAPCQTQITLNFAHPEIQPNMDDTWILCGIYFKPHI